MKKIILFLFTAVFGFPILSPTALVETELSYKIRNERGVHSFGTYHNGAAQVNLVNGNLMLKRPIFERPGAAGFNLDLSLYYNSKIWDRDATQMYARWSSGSLGVGWRFGFPSLKTGTSTYSIYEPDGSTHELQPYDDGTWRSIDSTYIIYDPSTKTATFSDGSKLKFQTMGCTFTDRNGNKITAYNDAYGRLSYARDTTGVAARFFYTTEGMLDYVLVYGKTYAKIEFYYEDAYLGPVYPPRFSLPVQTKTGRKFLKLITTRLPDRFLEERFSYFPGTGELYKIEKGVFYGSMERFDTIATFNYDTISFADPTYTTAEERVVTSTYEYSGTTSYSTSFNYTMNGNSSNPSQTKVTDIRGVTFYNFFSSVYPARSWKDGLMSSLQRQNSSLTKTYRTQTSDWEQDIPGAVYMVNPRRIGQTITLNDEISLTKEMVYSSDGTGNIKQLLEYKYDSTEVLRETTYDYLHETNPDYAARRLIRLPTVVSIKDGNGTEVSRTEYAYDEYPLKYYTTGGPGDYDYSYKYMTIRGHQTSIKRKYIEEDRFVITTVKYDFLGRVVSTTDPNNNTSSTEYSVAGSFVTWDHNALGQDTFYSPSYYSLYDYESQITENFCNGNIGSVRDINGHWHEYYYDELGRTTLIRHLGFNDEEFTYDDFYLNTTKSSATGDSRTQYNATGNKIQLTAEDPETELGDIVTTASYNNPWNQPSTESFPYRDGSPATNRTYTYDGMGRKLSVAIPGVGTTYFSYTANRSSTKYPDNKLTQFYYNESGQVIWVIKKDESANPIDQTTYSYDVLGNLLEIVKVGQDSMPDQTRTFTYDSLGRKTSETHPEKGTTTYTYYDNGNVLTKTDARGVVATFIYDALNRQTSVSYSDGTPSATYTYDETTSSLLGIITNGKGQMTSAWTSDGIGYSWSFDDSGRATTQVASIDGVEYPIDYSYYDAGCQCSSKSLRRITYPDTMTVDYARDGIERISEIYTDPANPYAEYNYDSPNGAVSKIEFGDSIDDNYSYDNLGRLDNLQLYKDSSQHSEWRFFYDSNSLISKIEEHTHLGTTSTYEKYKYIYDNLLRLESASHKTGSSWTSWNAIDQINSFSYDQYGNMEANLLEFPGNPSLDTQTTFDVNAINNRLNSFTNAQGTTTPVYDPAGNMTQEGAQSYTYDGGGRMIAVSGSNSGTYRYDALGRRIKKTYSYVDQSGTVSGSIISIYGSGDALLVDYKIETRPSGSNNSRTNYIINGSQTVARRIIPESGSATTEYLHRNHLGQVVNANNFSVGFGGSSMYALPFGSGGNDQFAGHKNDPESGLHYNLARSYNPIMSRWPSADSVTQNIYDPQSLNKYTYVGNNPINFVDPNGNFWNPFGGIWDLIVAIGTAISNWANNLDGGQYPPSILPILYMYANPNPFPETTSGGGGGNTFQAQPAINKVKELISNKNCHDFLIDMFSRLPWRYTPFWNKLIDVLNKPWQELFEFRQGTYATNSRGEPDARILAQTDIYLYGTIYLWKPFFDDASRDGQVMIILHEAVHSAVRQNDLTIARLYDDFNPDPSLEGDDLDNAASLFWDRKLNTACKK